MNENKNVPQKEEAPQTIEGAHAAKPSFSWRRLLTKKWAFPAIYMAAAAIILTLMWVYQGSGKTALTGEQVGLTTGKAATAGQTNPDALPAAAKPEAMQWPVKDHGSMEVSLPYFDANGTAEAKQAAMSEYEDTFIPHVGIDLNRSDNAAFDVMAALDGKVSNVELNALVGNQVEITHTNGLVTVYQSLDKVKVTKGAEVKKGDIIAQAGRNELEKDEGVHLHFEVRQGQDGPPVDPESVLPAE